MADGVQVKYHFLGISGHAMRGVALAARDLGHEVTGTDEGAYPPGSDWLDEQGFTWWQQPNLAHLKGVHEIIVSGHTQPDHPELLAASQQGIPVRSFPELIAELTKKGRRIVVAGTHGKTTTTSLITWLLESAGRKPDFLIGIKPHNFESSVRLAGGKVAVIEGDEYRASQLDTLSKFAFYQPTVAVVTSIEMDHPDFFRDLGDITGRFREFIGTVPADGAVYYWQGSPVVREAVEGVTARVAGYDFAEAEWWADNVRYEPAGLRFTLMHHTEAVAELAVPLYGAHNVLNATAASAVALGEGMTVEELGHGMVTFKGASRRFERVTPEDAPITVLDDYAHHPTEVKTTIEAAKLHFGGRVIAIFRPHTYSRTKKLLKEYQGAFGAADEAFIAEIEAAREAKKAQTVSGADIAAKAGREVRYEPDRRALVEAIVAAAKPGDTILCMSVNGYEDLAQELASRV